MITHHSRQGGIRTPEDISQRFYRPSVLTTYLPTEFLFLDKGNTNN